MNPSGSPTWGSSSTKPRVVVTGPDRDQVRGLWRAQASFLSQFADIIGTDFGFQGGPFAEADFALVLGGDGSMLASARCFGEHQIPVLGVNLGRLGFLAAISPEQLPVVWANVCQGGCEIKEHLMLEFRVEGREGVQAQGLALNEVAILGGPPFAMLHLNLYVDGEMATTYSCDGLILATPIGSTAHNLSAGGPILRKDLQAVVISALSPHTLTVRPVVDSADRKYEVVVSPPTEGAELVVDGRMMARLTPSDQLRVERASARFRMIEPPAQTYYQTLRDKLGWGGNITNRRRQT